MQFCFIRDSTALVMPVTPGSYQVSRGKKMETIRISQLGDVFRPGGTARFRGSFEFLLPAREYPWMEPGAAAEPERYLERLNAWAADDSPVRMVITGAGINMLVYIEEVTQAEQDGTGDIYAQVSVREYAELTAVETVQQPAAENTARSDGLELGAVQSYTIRSGDTLSGICRRYYGQSTAKYYNALASYNGIKNPHLIYPNVTIRIPPRQVLLGGAA